MPWNQAHAWKIFTKLIECYIDHKKDTLIAIVASVLVQGHDDIDAELGSSEYEMVKKINDMKLEDLVDGIQKNDGLLCDTAMSDFLKILYSVTQHDQECMTAVFSLLAKPKKDAGFIRKAVGWTSSLLGKIDLKMAQKNLIKVSKILADCVMKIACENEEKELAYECVRLKQMISDFGNIRNGNIICQRIDGIATQLNNVGAMLCVMAEFNKSSANVKLLEYKGGGEE